MTKVNKFDLFAVILLQFITGAFTQTAQGSMNNSTVASTDETRNGTCRYAPGLTVGDEPRVMECCNMTVRNFELRWSLGQIYLTTFLQSLQAWGCPQFEEQCDERFFAVNEFTGLVYDYYCHNYTDFIATCYDDVNATVVMGNEETTNRSWNSLISNLDSSELTLEQLNIPCVQVALYIAEGEHFGEFHEVISHVLPSCEPSWCGYDGETLRSRIITAWTCMSNSCRAKMVVIMVVCALLAVVITMVNLSVILVYVFNPGLLHSQGVYKVSLALADILVGVIVFPTFISSLVRITTRRQLHADYVDVIGYETIDGSLSSNATIVPVRAPGARFDDFFEQTYLDAVGFFTILSLSVSIYNLTVAGFDRLTAVYRPLSYRKDKAKSFAKKACVVLWGFGILFAVLPTFVPTLHYSVIASILVASGGQSALILYVVAFAIPIILMWAVNIATYHSTKKHAKVRRHLTIDSKKKTESIEFRLARTLSIMVGVFTLSIFPIFLVIVPSLFVSSIYYTQPREFDLQSAIVYGAFEFAAIIILSCNSLWNFFIYNARNLEFRKAVKAMYSRASDSIGLSRCCLSLRSCAARAVHGGQKRISSIPNISTTFTKKSSLVPTNTTTLNSKTKSNTFSTSEESSSKLKGSKLSFSDELSTNARTSELESSRLESSTDVSVTTLSSSAKKGTKGKKKKSKDSDKSVSEDSVFQSFAIDANADRLCMSVMEQIDEEIVDAGAEGRTEKV